MPINENWSVVNWQYTNGKFEDSDPEKPTLPRWPKVDWITIHVKTDEGDDAYFHFAGPWQDRFQFTNYIDEYLDTLYGIGGG